MKQTSPLAVPSPFVAGLTKDTLREAVRRGEVDRDMVSELAPPTAPGISGWSGKVEALRDLLMPLGWELSNARNFCTVRSPDDSIEIACTRGSVGTGDPNAMPESIRKLGDETRRVIAANRLQTRLDFVETPASRASRLTWFLVTCRSGNIISCELSLPESMENGYIVRWDPRYLLDDVDLREEPKARPSGPLPSGGGDVITVDFEVRRK